MACSLPTGGSTSSVSNSTSRSAVLLRVAGFSELSIEADRDLSVGRVGHVGVELHRQTGGCMAEALLDDCLVAPVVARFGYPTAEEGAMSGRSLSHTSKPVAASVATGVAININARDAKALIQWMQNVLGFDLVALYEDLDDGHVRASRLELGNHAVHVSQRGPSNTAARNGVGIGVIARDNAAVDALYERALAAGAEVVAERERADTGSYRFSVRDPEGDVWGVSTTWHDKPESLNRPERVI